MAGLVASVAMLQLLRAFSFLVRAPGSASCRKAGH